MKGQVGADADVALEPLAGGGFHNAGGSPAEESETDDEAEDQPRDAGHIYDRVTQ